MEDFVQKLYDFILFFVNVIKDLVASVSGKAPNNPAEPEENTEETE